MTISASDFLKNIKDNLDTNIYFISGEDGFLRNSCKKTLLSKFAVSFPEMNFVNIKDKVSYDDIKNTVIQAPCFFDYRVVLLENVDITSKDTGFEKIFDILPKETKLIIEIEKADERKAVIKRIVKDYKYITCQSLDEADLKKWVLSHARKEKITLSRNVMDIMIEISNSDMFILSNEIQKLKLSNLTNPTEEDIKSLMSGSVDYDIFEFHNLMLNGNPLKAFEIFERIKKDRTALGGFVGLLVNKFIAIYCAKMCALLHMREYDIADKISATLKIKRYPALLAARECNKFSKEQIINAIRQLEKLDRMIKTTYRIENYKTLFLKMYGKI